VRDDGRDEHLTVAEAAGLLGTSKEAVRKQIARGTSRSEKHPDGTVRVYVRASPTSSGQPSGGGRPFCAGQGDARRVRFLEEQLRREQDAHSEARRLVAALIQRVLELEAPSEPSGAPESAEEEPERTEHARPPQGRRRALRGPGGVGCSVVSELGEEAWST
jgi:hypothetical protein